MQEAKITKNSYLTIYYPGIFRQTKTSRNLRPYLSLPYTIKHLILAGNGNSQLHTSAYCLVLSQPSGFLQILIGFNQLEATKNLVHSIKFNENGGKGNTLF